MARSPMIAARLGRSCKRPLRRDWESMKENVMRRAVLKTSDEHDWGCGSTGTGKNRLGQLLMEVRSLLRERAQPGG